MSLNLLMTNTIAPLTGIANSVWMTAAIGIAGSALLCWLLFRICYRYIPNNAVGIVEKPWSFSGSVADGRIAALGNEAGFRAELLRGGYHFGYWPWQYRIHRT